VHSLRHTMLTRLGEAGADAFTIMKIAAHSSVTVSQRHVHPTPEGMERAFERRQELNAAKFQEAEREIATAGAEGAALPAKAPYSQKKIKQKSPQAFVIKRAGP